MNTLTNTERPKLKLNLAKPVMPTINSSSLASRKVVVLEKPKKTVNKDTSLDTAKVQNKQNLKNDAKTKNEDTLARNNLSARMMQNRAERKHRRLKTRW